MDAGPSLSGAIEALLFVSDEPVSAARIARVLEAAESEVASTLKELAAGYQEGDRGFQLREVAGGWRFYTHPAYHEAIEAYVLSWDTRRLSQAALEALAVVAYHQPVTRAGINAVRGVNSEGVLASLVEKGLVKEVGRDRNAGNAILYGTTRAFLEKFGLKDLTELPPLAEFAPDAVTERAIRDRLTAVDGPDIEEFAGVSGGDARAEPTDDRDAAVLEPDGAAPVEAADDGEVAADDVIDVHDFEHVEFDPGSTIE